MAHRRGASAIPASLWRAVRGTFDFSGRATRSEFWAYSIFIQLFVALSLALARSFIVEWDFETERELNGVASLVLVAPAFALFVRRMHDQDRSGWWVMLLAVVIIFAVLSDNGSPSVPGVAKVETPWWLDLAGVACIIQIWVLSLLPPSAGSNRYGPNPRLDPGEVAA